MNTKSPIEIDGRQRRVVLQGALAACCALVLPILPGCGKGKEPASPTPEVGKASPPVPQANGEGASASSPQSGTKLSKAQVQYEEKANGEQKWSTCNNFIAEAN